MDDKSIKKSIDVAEKYLWDIDEGDFSIYANIDGQAYPLAELKNPVQAAREIVEVLRAAPKLYSETARLRAQVEAYRELVEALKERVQASDAIREPLTNAVQQLAEHPVTTEDEDIKELARNYDLFLSASLGYVRTADENIAKAESKLREVADA